MPRVVGLSGESDNISGPELQVCTIGIFGQRSGLTPDKLMTSPREADSSALFRAGGVATCPIAAVEARQRTARIMVFRLVFNKLPGRRDAGIRESRRKIPCDTPFGNEILPGAEELPILVG